MSIQDTAILSFDDVESNSEDDARKTSESEDSDAEGVDDGQEEEVEVDSEECGYDAPPRKRLKKQGGRWKRIQNNLDDSECDDTGEASGQGNLESQKLDSSDEGDSDCNAHQPQKGSGRTNRSTRDKHEVETDSESGSSVEVGFMRKRRPQVIISDEDEEEEEDEDEDEEDDDDDDDDDETEDDIFDQKGNESDTENHKKQTLDKQFWNTSSPAERRALGSINSKNRSNAESKNDVDAPSRKSQGKPGEKPMSEYWNNLLGHLKKLSYPIEGKELKHLLGEWYFIWVEDLNSCSGRCPCGKQGIRYKYHIKNLKTGNKTYVGSRCIGQFKLCDKTVVKLAKELHADGIIGTLIDMENLKFEIRGDCGLVKARENYRSSGNLPLQLPRKANASCPVLTVTAAEKVCNKIHKMKEGMGYRIWLQLSLKKETNGRGSWTVEMIRFAPVLTRILVPRDVKQFIRE